VQRDVWTLVLGLLIWPDLEIPPELVSFLHVKIVLSLMTEMVFLSEVSLLFYIRNSGWGGSTLR
jgi:hypothetical protein